METAREPESPQSDMVPLSPSTFHVLIDSLIPAADAIIDQKAQVKRSRDDEDADQLRSRQEEDAVLTATRTAEDAALIATRTAQNAALTATRETQDDQKGQIRKIGDADLQRIRAGIRSQMRVSCVLCVSETSDVESSFLWMRPMTKRYQECWSHSEAVRVDGRTVRDKLHPRKGVESTRWQSTRSKLKLVLILLHKAYIPSLPARRTQVRSSPTKFVDTLALSPAVTECSRVNPEPRDTSNR